MAAGVVVQPKYEDMLFTDPNGRCYLADVDSGTIRLNVETGNGALYLVNKGDVLDYLDLKPQHPDRVDLYEDNMNFYHYKPNNIDGELVPLVNAGRKEIKKYLDNHYDDSLTTVTHTKRLYPVNYDTGHIDHDIPEEAAFKIERVDFCINRPGWSLSIARIKASFPPYLYGVRKICNVYHSRNSQKFIQLCHDFNLQPLPADSHLNRLIISNRDLTRVATINRQIQIDSSSFVQGKHGIRIHFGTWEGRDAFVKVVPRQGPVDTKRMLEMINMSGFHENLVNFYRWETDGVHEYFAFERVAGETLHQYVHNNKYEEMSESAVKIMKGLKKGVMHLHARKVAHLNLNPHNILITRDGTVKICGLGNSKPLDEVQLRDQQDLHSMAHVILHIISNGKHKVPDKTAAETFTLSSLDQRYIDTLKLTGTNFEALHLLEKIGIIQATPPSNYKITRSAELGMLPLFWKASKRVEFFGDLSDHLYEGKPNPQLKKDIENILNDVVPLVLPSQASSISSIQHQQASSISSTQHQQRRSWFNVLGGSTPGSLLHCMRGNQYTDCEVESLLRFPRNALSHIEGTRADQQKKIIAQHLGTNVTELEAKFRAKFPRLLTKSHDVGERYKATIGILKKYYR